MDSSHKRAIAASLGGLLLQLGAFVGILVLALRSQSPGVALLAWYVLGGVLIWLAALLVSNQRKLVLWEQRDLEELRREKQAAGTDTSMFDGVEGGGLGYQAGEKRLAWMLRWLVPAFGLMTAGYLVIYGVMLLFLVRSLQDDWPKNGIVGVTVFVAGVAVFVLFLYSRYAAGMGRRADWHLLRAGGSYMLGNAIFAFLLGICLALQLADANWIVWEQRLAYVIPAIMVLLGAETVLNFVADIYRPRSKRAESRACYDSRVLGVFSEPGGIAHSIAEAVNYQFGFQVSQTWFYRFLAKYLVPVIGVGALALWLITCVVIVNPYERVIIERFGKLIDSDHPLQPGLAFKLPWPLAKAHVRSTDELHQIILGAKFREAKDRHDSDEPDVPDVVLWSESGHADDHFNFLVSIKPDDRADESDGSGGTNPADERGAGVAVHILQLSLAVQYKIDAERVADHMTRVQNPEDLIRDVAWRETIEFVATADVDALLGDPRGVPGPSLEERIVKRVAQLNMGIDVVYVGLQAVHPVASVAKSFEDVIVARQEKTARIRSAQVIESQALSRAAGDRRRALSLVESIDNRDRYASIQTANEQTAGSAPAAISDSIAGQLVKVAPQFVAVIEAQLETDRAKAALQAAEDDFKLGIAGTMEELTALTAQLDAAIAKKSEVEAALSIVLAPVREQAASHLTTAQIEALVQTVHARFGLQFWNRRLESQFLGLGGAAAQIIAEAQADRWNTENRALADLARLNNERQAYHAAPELYMNRKYLATLVAGLREARKYFLAFDPGDREIKVRIEAQEVIGPDFSLTGE